MGRSTWELVLYYKPTVMAGKCSIESRSHDVPPRIVSVPLASVTQCHSACLSKKVCSWGLLSILCKLASTTALAIRGWNHSDFDKVKQWLFVSIEKEKLQSPRQVTSVGTYIFVRHCTQGKAGATAQQAVHFTDRVLSQNILTTKLTVMEVENGDGKWRAAWCCTARQGSTTQVCWLLRYWLLLKSAKLLLNLPKCHSVWVSLWLTAWIEGG